MLSVIGWLWSLTGLRETCTGREKEKGGERKERKRECEREIGRASCRERV